MVKNLPAKQAMRVRSLGQEKSPGKGNGTPGLLPGKSHGQRSLAGYSPRGHKETDMTERLNNSSIHHHHLLTTERGLPKVCFKALVLFGASCWRVG